MAVVVLPTPPFWLARARIRGVSECGSSTRPSWLSVTLIADLTLRPRPAAEFRDAKNAPVGIGPTRENVAGESPGLPRFRQFSLIAAPLWKQADGAACQKAMRQLQQLG